MKFFSKNEDNNLFQIGELLNICHPNFGWVKKINKKVSNLTNSLEPEFIIVYDFNENILKNPNDNEQVIGKRVYVPSGTSCLYLCCDAITTKNSELDEENIIFELHRILIENKTYWIFDVFLQKIILK